MEKIKVFDKWFKLYISAVEIGAAINKLARELNTAYEQGEAPLFVSILNGSFMFTADLMKKIDVECDLSFLKYTSYRGLEQATAPKELIGLDEEVGGRKIVILDEIVDSGTTIKQLKDMLTAKGAAEVKVATLIYKPNSCRKDVTVDYYGICMQDNNFVVGYGLDYKGRARNYEDIYILL